MPPDPAERHQPDVGQVLRQYRLSQSPRMPQVQLARLLNVDQSHLSTKAC